MPLQAIIGDKKWTFEVFKVFSPKILITKMTVQ